jgi:beta-galactosidase
MTTNSQFISRAASCSQSINQQVHINRVVPWIFAFLCLCIATFPSQVSAQGQSANAMLPTGISLNWDQTNIVWMNAMRSEMPLDGIWRFIPATAGEASPPKLGWGYINVPGNWGGGGHRHRRADDDQEAPSALVAPGSGPQWENFNKAGVASAWYEREVQIPADWQGRVISLHFDRVCTDAIIYVNGMECGQVPWPWGSVNITRAVTPGKTADVQVLVAAIADSQMVGHFWQNAFMAVTYSAARLETRGLTGSVYLEGRPTDGRVSDVFIRTSTRKKDIALDVDLDGVEQKGRLHFVAEMLNEKGQVEKTFTADTGVEAKTTQTVTVSWPWTNPRLWDVNQPNLYTLRLTVTGAGMSDQFNQEFGFREFWIEGRQFYLNGTVIHLRQPCFYNGPIGEVGDNFREFGSWTPDTRGDPSDAGPDLDEADHKGYLAATYVFDANKYMRDRSGNLTWKQNQQHALDRAMVWMRHYRNHPSVVMWVAGANFFNDADDMDPRHIGHRGWEQSNPQWKPLMDDARDMFAALKQLDPTRAYYSHEGSDTGDAHSMNCYLDFLPLQERDDLLSAWAKNGDMPIAMTEFGTPMDCTFRRGRDGFTSNIHSEPLLTEYAAIYFGTNAYTSEEPAYRQYLRNLFQGGMTYGSTQDKLDPFANMLKIQDLFRKSTWESWRTAGLPGGLRTWSWMQDELEDINYPTMAWIAGQSEAYTSKDHHFLAGKKFQKQIILINDMRQPEDFTATWTATVNGNQVSTGDLHGNLAVSEIRKLPIEITAPEIEAGGKADGQITLTATIGGVTHHDTFAFRVFGTDQPAGGDIATVDSAGLTTKMLKNLGYSPQSWDGAAASLVVVGRNDLKDDPTMLGKLDSYVQGGGRVLIFAQDPSWIGESLGWRVCPKVSRYVFPVPHSPVSQWIDADDLCNWTGSSTLIPAYPEYVGNYLRGNEGNQPYAGWHWGNQGGVSSAAIEKPDRSGWSPLLECEFDMAYTPLMELNYGRGRVIVCTLDLEDHVSLDPVARLLAGRLMDYALHSSLAPRANKTVYLGGPAGASWLNKIGVNFEQASALDASAGLVLVGSDANVDEAALNSYLEEGGKVFFLPRTQADGPLGTTLVQAADQFAGSLSPPDWPEAKGLSASDLRWRTYIDSPPWILSGGADVGADGLLGRKIVGKGVAIFCQVDPDRFNADENTYFHYTRWRSTRAVAQLLTDLGASFQVDSGIFHPLKVVSDPDSEWIGPDGDISGHDCTPRAPDDLTRPASAQLGYYYPDYRTDFPMGDNPYRFYRW